MKQGRGRPEGEKTKVISFRVLEKHAEDISNAVKKFIKDWYPQDKYKRK